MKADYSQLAIPKPGVRVRDPAAIRATRRPYCEHCRTPRGPFHVHHLKSRGAGGGDVAANLINLCAACHDRAHRGLIARERLEQIVARRVPARPALPGRRGATAGPAAQAAAQDRPAGARPGRDRVP